MDLNQIKKNSEKIMSIINSNLLNNIVYYPFGINQNNLINIGYGRLGWCDWDNFSLYKLSDITKFYTKCYLSDDKYNIIKINENKLVSAFIYIPLLNKNNYESTPLISIKFYDLKKHINIILLFGYKCLGNEGLCLLNSMLMLNDNILLFGIWLIDVNTYQIIYEIDIKPFSFCRCDALKLSNGNILFITNFEKSGEFFYI